MNFSPEAGIEKFFESKICKCLHILLNGGMYFLKAKLFQSFSFENMKVKNKLPEPSKHIPEVAPLSATQLSADARS